MTKKTVITAVALLLVLAGLIVGYKLLKDKNERDEAAKQEEEVEQAISVTDFDTEKMTSLSYKNEKGEVALTKTAAGWVLEDDPLFPIDTAKADNMANALSGLGAKREITSADESEFGFDSPTLTVSGEWKDGAVSLTVGAKNDFSNTYYLRDEGTGKIYLVESGFESVFDYAKNDLLKLDEFPEIDNTKAVSLKIRDADGNESEITDPEVLPDAASVFKRLTFSSDNVIYASDDEIASLGFSTSGPYAELAYKKSVTVSNEDGSMGEAEADETMKLFFGNAHTVEITADDGTVSEAVYYYYTTPENHIIYSIGEATYTELMRFAAGTEASE